MRRLLSCAVLAVALTSCGSRDGSFVDGRPPPSSCTPPAGGRCAADVPWPGPIDVTTDGRLLHGIIDCGGTLTAVTQSSDRVTVRLHVDARGPGMMSCARVDVGVRLTDPLGGRPVYDAVSGRRIRVEQVAHG
jgi:hypothetical protein